MMPLIIIVAVIGLCISIYTYTVERKIKNNTTYKPMCDLSDRISCTKPMLSKYGNLFYFSNAFMSIACYVLIILLAALNAHTLLFFAAAGICLVSVFLAYLLFFKIKSFCILCVSMYTINFIILVLAVHQLHS